MHSPNIYSLSATSTNFLCLEDKTERIWVGGRQKFWTAFAEAAKPWLSWRGTTDKSLRGLTPPYLSEDCQLVTDMGRRHLRSADVHTGAVPRTRLGDRSFTVAGPRLWNNLPVELRQRDICLSEFRRLLKTFLFCWDSAPYDYLFKCAVVQVHLLTY